MTCACLVCGTILDTPVDTLLDDQRDQREMQAIGARVAEHIGKAHPAVMAYLFAMGNSLSGLGLFAACSSGDERFNTLVENMRAQLVAYTQKITPGVLPKLPEPPGVPGKKLSLVNG